MIGKKIYLKGTNGFRIGLLISLGSFLLVCSVGCATTQGIVENALAGDSEFVELTHSLRTGAPSADAFRAHTEPVTTIDRNGKALNRIIIFENSGTNIEAPARLITGAVSVDHLPLSLFMGYGVVVDISKKVERDPSYSLQRSDLEEWEAEHGPIPTESILLVRTGWDSRWQTPDRYLNRDKAGKPRFPGISADAIEFVVRERRVHALGIDTPSVYEGSGNTSGQHTFLTSGKYHINNLTGLDRLPIKGALIIATPLKIEHGTGAPARVIAIIPRKKTEVEPGKKKVEQDTSGGMDNSGLTGGRPRY